MNLIEKLGGYDDARKSLQWLIDNDEDYIQEESNLYHACLQYRRENNIFEVGDEVIILTNAIGNKYIWRVKSIDGCMIELTQIGNINEWLHASEITHTTDENTKNGVRL